MNMNDIRLFGRKPFAQAFDIAQGGQAFFSYSPIQVRCTAGTCARAQWAVGSNDGDLVSSASQVFAEFGGNQLGTTDI